MIEPLINLPRLISVLPPAILSLAGQTAFFLFTLGRGKAVWFFYRKSIYRTADRIKLVCSESVPPSDGSGQYGLVSRSQTLSPQGAYQLEIKAPCGERVWLRAAETKYGSYYSLGSCSLTIKPRCVGKISDHIEHLSWRRDRLMEDKQF